jgi:anti-sigma factor RsiW
MVLMCPNRQVISLYYDQEIPSPWKEKIEAHLADCPECREILVAYGLLGKRLDDAPEDAVTAAGERVWKKLTAPELVSGGIEDKKIVSRTKSRNWNITMPIPVAAAAVLVIIASLAFVGMSALNQPHTQDQMVTATSNIAVDDQEIVPVTDVSGIIQYLSSQGIGDFVVIRLPAESPNFSRTGEPVLINASHYQPRRNISRW